MNNNRGIWVAYFASLLTPFTFLISGIGAILYAGYRLDKNEDGDVVNSHYYGLIRSFFLYLTFFVVLIVTVATSNGVLAGVHNYWYKASWIDSIRYVIPYVGAGFAVIAIAVWMFRIVKGMKKLQQNLPLDKSKGPNL